MSQSSLAAGRSHDYWIDNIKGVLMIAVVLGHLTSLMRGMYPSMRFVYDLINTFHMGAFMMISGYLSKRRIDQKDYIGVINKNVVPYLVSQVLLYCFCAIFARGLEAATATFFNSTTFSLFIPLYQLWYLFAIIVYVFLTSVIKPNRHPLLFLCGALLLSLACGYFRQVQVFKMTKILSFYFFFLLGYLMPEKVMDTLRKKRWLMAVAVLIWIGFVFFISNEDWCYRINKVYALSSSYAGCGPLYNDIPAVVGRLLILVLVPFIALAFFSLCPRGKNPLSKLGKNSMYIYILHALFVVVLRVAHYKYGILESLTTWWAQALFLIGGVVLTFILGSEWVKKLFRPILQPNFDIVKVVGGLCDRYRADQNKTS